MYQITKNINFDFVKEKLEKVFASRCKPITEKSLSIWVDEIIACNFQRSSISQGIQEFVDNEELALSLPIIKRLIKKYETPITQTQQYCPYCNGSGYVRALKFDDKGNYIDQQDTILGCVCGNNRDNSLKIMDENPQNYHRTNVSDGYYLVFKNVVERENIINTSAKNG